MSRRQNRDALAAYGWTRVKGSHVYHKDGHTAECRAGAWYDRDGTRYEGVGALLAAVELADEPNETASTYVARIHGKIAAHGMAFSNANYSQLENRVLARYAQSDARLMAVDFETFYDEYTGAMWWKPEPVANRQAKLQPYAKHAGHWGAR